MEGYPDVNQYMWHFYWILQSFCNSQTAVGFNDAMAHSFAIASSQLWRHQIRKPGWASQLLASGSLTSSVPTPMTCSPAHNILQQLIIRLKKHQIDYHHHYTNTSDISNKTSSGGNPHRPALQSWFRWCLTSPSTAVLEAILPISSTPASRGPELKSPNTNTNSAKHLLEPRAGSWRIPPEQKERTWSVGRGDEVLSDNAKVISSTSLVWQCKGNQ